MLKIEFKEAIKLNEHLGADNVFITTFFEYKNFKGNDMLMCYAFDELNRIKNITFGCPSELVPSREEVLTQLGITKEQDEANQKEWSKL